MLKDNTLVKIYNTCDHNIVVISTYSRKFGRHGRFMINAKTLGSWIAEWYFSADGHDNSGNYYDQDLGNHIKLWHYKGKIVVTFDWLREDNSGNLCGVRQSFELPDEDFIDACNCEKVVGLLGYPIGTLSESEVHFMESAQKTVGKMDKQKRRALSKALRNGALQWPDTTTSVYADGGFDFFFRCDDGMRGGLIKHENERLHGNECYYGIHT